MPFCSFDNMKMFVQKSVSVLSDVELVAIFVGLDLQSECKIE